MKIYKHIYERKKQYIYIYIYIKRLRPTTGPGLWISNLGRTFLEACGAGLGSKLGVWGVQKAPPRLQILLPRPGGWGVASFIGS